MVVMHVKGLHGKSLHSMSDLTNTITCNFKTHYKATLKVYCAKKINVSQTFPRLCCCSSRPKIFIRNYFNWKSSRVWTNCSDSGVFRQVLSVLYCWNGVVYVLVFVCFLGLVIESVTLECVEAFELKDWFKMIQRVGHCVLWHCSLCQRTHD